MKNETCQKKLNKHYAIAFWITLVVAIGLIICGFFMPPKGTIDGSILTSTGEIFLWPALALGAKSLEDGRVAKIRFLNTSLNIGQDKDGNGFDDDWEIENQNEEIES